MGNELRPGVTSFENDDSGFIEWCIGHPDGYLFNCAGTVEFPFMLHAATRNGELCPHFRNSSLASGYEPNLTGKFPKVCSVDRSLLETWAEETRPGFDFKKCSTCTGLR